MLAQNFKTPAELDISDKEFDALFKVLGMLERGELRYVSFDELEPSDVGTGVFSGLFNMADYEANHSCGTACCIAGTADLLFGTKFSEYCQSMELEELFIALQTPVYLADIKPHHAAIALRNYLTFGEPRWSEALSE